MTTSPTGIKLIQGYEGCELNAYKDAASPPVITIGWGTTRYPNGNKIQMGDTCTKA